MPCWPELWDEFKIALPTLGLVASGTVYVALVATLLWAPRVRKRWQRVTARVFGAMGIVPIVVLLPAFLFAVFLTSGDPPPRTHKFLSPDGQQAELRYQAGFLGRDYTEVTLKLAGCCRHSKVFAHGGPSEFNDPVVEWLDNRHLKITYHTRPGDSQHCQQRVGEVSIACVSLPWPK